MWVWLTISYLLPIYLDLREQNFDILIGYDNEPIIAFHQPSSTIGEDGSVPQNLDMETDSRGIEVLNGLCHQVRHSSFVLFHDLTLDKLY